MASSRLSSGTRWIARLWPRAIAWEKSRSTGPKAQTATFFASEIKSLLASGLIRPKIDRLAIDAYLGLSYIPPDRTVYSNVHTLAPGGAMAWANGQLRTWRYWEPAYSTRDEIDWGEAVEETRRLVATAVERQMVSDVPVGEFLSGGLDSSTVVALMAQHRRGRSPLLRRLRRSGQ